MVRAFDDQTDDLVVLVDAEGRAIGTADRTGVHTPHTPRHLAFSLYVLDDAGRLLLTRRALTKRAWPGVWTNSCCGHPRPGEEMSTAVRRRVAEELGLDIEEPRVVLPDFGYRAVDASGVVEHELCPVHVVTVPAGTEPRADPAEVVEHAWVAWPDVVRLVAAAPALVSPWMAEQVPLLAAGALSRLESDEERGVS
ncbi:isopentenyl-diphosphate Delta-isomerase [Nocardioides acrostichi]|uniref:Isopentenyl-diphosphate Delta-isomerase n=1 Tax=Nocardioides acrostichi TaxID=2784339 RepID=A0A930UWC6_9ACTN|nr:isopentenyl-diphosphate Delta-isomerase [Nocardioides acrostichi]MBF4160270.1 isopentenyl-diphosphate Delta-isomerase [Nocardioides acrostichi]